MAANAYFEEKIKSTFSPMDYMMQAKESPEKFYLVDVRNGLPHLKKEKIEGAVEIPQAELENRLNELPKDKTLVLYCWDVWCNTAAKAALTLIDKGFDVKELAGGIAAWNKMEFPTETVEGVTK
ncbi:rhodanese-like domain-containing protein [Alteribacillus bidgolensis]|uniref:Rhodanese-related sulfurtransferase n=1 Tax=Alteribacillus bidgolensis TaxID=930129 RepID=A0A1G8K539_9BACI|nr:rhodanese-like domain-containing protein [Alteribacillus bidgolensis]SDI38523.1 Rhodanese-related sulfurtransferase [Alteribacillus bidgolensis]